MLYILRPRNKLSCTHLVRSVYSFVPQNIGGEKPYTMNVTFLGTSSGGGPTPNRNCSSLVCDFFEGSNLWMVDCAEGTTRQFALQPQRHSLPRIRINQINRLFVTHMHGAYCHFVACVSLTMTFSRPYNGDSDASAKYPSST